MRVVPRSPYRWGGLSHFVRCMNPLVMLTIFRDGPVEQFREISQALGLHPRLSCIPATGDMLATADIRMQEESAQMLLRLTPVGLVRLLDTSPIILAVCTIAAYHRASYSW